MKRENYVPTVYYLSEIPLTDKITKSLQNNPFVNLTTKFEIDRLYGVQCHCHQLYSGGQCSYLCFPRVLLTSIPHNILSKPLAAFPHNLCRNHGYQSERNEFYCNDYHQSSGKKYWPGRVIKPATFCSQVLRATD